MDAEWGMLQQWLLSPENTTFFTSIALSISLVVVIIFYSLNQKQDLNLPPSPPKLPLIGNLHQVDRSLHRSLHLLSRRYGPIMLLRFGQIPVLVVSSADLAKEVSCNDVFANRPRIKAAETLFYGCTDIAFCPLGDYWRQAKKICVNEVLSQRKVLAFRFVREEEVKKMVRRVCASCSGGMAVDLAETLQSLSNNIISRSALGRVYERENGQESFAELSKRLLDLIGAFYVGDFLPFLGWIDHLTGSTEKLTRTSGEMHDFLDRVIEEHRCSRRRDDDSEDEKNDRKDIVDILLRLQEDGKLDPCLTTKNLKAILLDMFSGGTDTAAIMMEWAMAELAKNPRTMKEAQEEVRRVVGVKSNVEEADVNRMDYLKCVVKETLRLHSPTLVTRQSSVITKLRGYDIPPKTTVFINTWAIHKDPEVWDRPEEFVPERFAESSLDLKGQSGQFMPFGGGKRLCPGILFAMAEAEYVLANLLYWFDWDLPDGMAVEELDMSDAPTLMIRKRVPLCLVPKVHSFDR